MITSYRSATSVIALALAAGLATPVLAQSTPAAAAAAQHDPEAAPAASAGAGVDPQAANVQATDAAAPTASATSDGGLKDIVVTAQRRAENIQRVPISIVAVSGENLTKSGVTTLQGLQSVAPGLTVASVGGFVSYTYIRGGGTNQIDPGSDPSVAYFVDEIYQGGNEGLQFDLFDIDHVEVLKGPQGTLFGRNASSGAISVVTKRPSNAFGGTADVEFGSFNSLIARGSVTGPLNNDGSLLFRTSLAYRRRDAYTTNLLGTGDPGYVNAGGVRQQLEYKQGNFDALLTGSYYKARNGQTNLFLTTPTVAGYVDPTLAQPTDQSFYKHYYDFIGFENQDSYDVNGRIEVGTAVGKLISISAFRSNIFKRNQDGDGTEYFASIQDSYEHTRTFSQELRLVGDATPWLHHVFGLYYYHSDVDFTYFTPKGPANPSVTARNKSITDSSAYVTNSYAAFGQLRVDFTKHLDLTLGGRYTSDHKSDDRAVNIYGNGYAVDPSATFHAFTPSITLEYKPSDEILTYFSYRKGFKSGGFQSLAPANAGLASIPFLPEFVESYEVGAKASVLDNRVKASVALFRSDVENQQVNRFTTVVIPINGVSTSFNGNVIDNAGQTRDDGIDLSLTARPFRPLVLSANMTFQRARFQSYVNTANGINYTGNQQLRSPNFTGYFSADYTLPLNRLGDFTLHADYTRQSNEFFDALNSSLPGLHQPAYGIANLRATLALHDHPVELSVFARNIGDVHYFTNVAIIGTTGQGIPGVPRTIGGAIDIKF